MALLVRRAKGLPLPGNHQLPLGIRGDVQHLAALALLFVLPAVHALPATTKPPLLGQRPAGQELQAALEAGQPLAPAAGKDAFPLSFSVSAHFPAAGRAAQTETVPDELAPDGLGEAGLLPPGPGGAKGKGAGGRGGHITFGQHLPAATKGGHAGVQRLNFRHSSARGGGGGGGTLQAPLLGASATLPYCFRIGSHSVVSHHQRVAGDDEVHSLLAQRAAQEPGAQGLDHRGELGRSGPVSLDELPHAGAFLRKSAGCSSSEGRCKRCPG